MNSSLASNPSKLSSSGDSSGCLPAIGQWLIKLTTGLLVTVMVLSILTPTTTTIQSFGVHCLVSHLSTSPTPPLVSSLSSTGSRSQSPRNSDSHPPPLSSTTGPNSKSTTLNGDNTVPSNIPSSSTSVFSNSDTTSLPPPPPSSSPAPPKSQAQCSSPLSSAQDVLTFNAKTVDDFDCEQLDFCDDRLGFEAILYLHRQLDEDANGDVDISESDEFLRDELKYENCAERQKAFHGNDKHITVDELWRSWKISAVHNWSVEQTVEWLCTVVELPKYKEKFELHAIDGIALPRLAANPQFFIILGINNAIHKQKIALKAMDVVLFGMPKPNTLTKDLVMCALLVFAIGVGWYAFYQHKDSQQHIRQMMKDMESLSNAEKQLEYLQLELNRTKQEHENAFREKRDLERKLKENEQQQQHILALGSNSSGDFVSESRSSFEEQRVLELEKELFLTQNELKRLEQAFSARQWVPPLALQEYLQLTYEIEIKNYNAKKSAAEMQLHAAREGCDKLKKKRSTLLGAFRMAHGSSIDYVDNTILQARTLLAELTNEMQERIKRWKQIETFCGFDIIHNPGYSNLEQLLYGCVNGGGSSTNSASSPTSSTSSTSISKSLMRKGSDATLVEDDTLSFMAVPSAFPFSSSTTTSNQNGNIPVHLWQNQPNANCSLPIRKISTTSSGFHPNAFSQPQTSITDDDNNGAMFFSSDVDCQTNGKCHPMSNVYSRISNKRNSSINSTVSSTAVTNNNSGTSSVSGSNSVDTTAPLYRPKTLTFSTAQALYHQPHAAKLGLLNYRRGSSDGVERHFEDLSLAAINNNNSSTTTRQPSSLTLGSQSDNNILLTKSTGGHVSMGHSDTLADNSAASVVKALVSKTKLKELNNNNSGSNYHEDIVSSSSTSSESVQSTNSPTGSNSHQQSLLSSSPSSTTTTANQQPNTQSSSKKRNFFGIRKRRFSKTDK